MKKVPIEVLQHLIGAWQASGSCRGGIAIVAAQDN